MKNRAKCKLCSSIIESFHPNDHVLCKCGEIEINGGEAMLAKAKDFANFLRVDDLGNEIVVQYRQKPEDIGSNGNADDPKESLAKEELLDMLDTMIKGDEGLPDKVKENQLNTYDLLRYMYLIKEMFKRILP